MFLLEACEVKKKIGSENITVYGKSVNKKKNILSLHHKSYTKVF